MMSQRSRDDSKGAGYVVGGMQGLREDLQALATIHSILESIKFVSTLTNESESN